MGRASGLGSASVCIVKICVVLQTNRSIDFHLPLRSAGSYIALMELFPRYVRQRAFIAFCFLRSRHRSFPYCRKFLSLVFGLSFHLTSEH